GAGDSQLDARDVLGGGGRCQRPVRQCRHARPGVRRDDRIRSQADHSMTLVLYLVFAILTIAAWNRYVGRVLNPPGRAKSPSHISRRTAIVLILLPFPFVGPALLTNRVYGGHDLIFLSQPWSGSATK